MNAMTNEDGYANSLRNTILTLFNKITDSMAKPKKSKKDQNQGDLFA